MKRLATFAFIAFALSLFAGVLAASDAAPEKPLKEQVIGTWSYVSVDIIRPDGTREPMYGPNPKGLAVFDGNGRYILMTIRSGQQKFASSNRLEGTAEENKSVVYGSIAHFGKYSVNEADKSITFHVDASTFPNWNGSVQTRPVALNGDELRWTTAGSSGGTAEVVLRRAK